MGKVLYLLYCLRVNPGIFITYFDFFLVNKSSRQEREDQMLCLLCCLHDNPGILKTYLKSLLVNYLAREELASCFTYCFGCVLILGF